MHRVRFHRADGEGAASGARASAGHRRGTVVPRAGNDDDSCAEQLHGELVSEAVTREERRAADAHVHDLDFQRVEHLRFVLGPIATDRHRWHSVVEVPTEGQHAVHRRDEP